MSLILVDTNVWSEVTKPSPALSVVTWLDRNRTRLATSVMVVAEALAGAQQISDRLRRQKTVALYDGAFAILSQPAFIVDETTARRAAELAGQSRGSGVVMKNADALIAATAQIHRAALATRNAKDFKATGLTLIDPWTDA